MVEQEESSYKSLIKPIDPNHQWQLRISINKAGDRKYKLGLNHFADTTKEEFEASHLRVAA